MFTNYIDHLINSIQDKEFFVITTSNPSGEWYFFDVENHEPPYIVAWTARKSSAFKFSSYKAADNLRAEVISPRQAKIKCISEA